MNSFSNDTQDKLDSIYDEAYAIASEWNGDDAGVQEERAHCASDIMDKIKELKQLISEMETL